MEDKQILNELSELIKLGKTYPSLLKDKYECLGYSYNKKENENYSAELRKWEYRATNLLKLRFGENHDFLKRFKQCIRPQFQELEYYKENIQLAIAALEFIYDSLSKGLTEDLYFKREIILFSDMLKQAQEFLETNLKLAAAIYGRIIMELTIKEFAKKNNLDSEKKFDEIIINLRKKDLIHSPFESSLRANYKIGSLAAHGNDKFKEFSDSEIREYLSFIRDKVLTLE